MRGDTLSIVLVATLALILVSAGIQDARTREIANWKNAAIALLAPFYWWACGLAVWPDMAAQFGLALIVFALFIATFQLGWMGGGDVKMIGALALWLPLVPLVWMLIVMSLVGGALTAVVMIEHRLRRRTTPVEIPYGVAIAIAALFALREPLFNHFGVNA
ncbi:type 4 prepilin peptidase 1 [Sphingomonas glacialis]|uniref:Type 4 prepilin peptidase 1 n=1 Tax=Sphingomonas glacialis TaxID=658225 RepID=A0ABQ3LBU9_9SPHN|nr:prepilin peptidase [Sphingomonas glacialis]GHH11517.1 type 4 prepilin peptidase 1 [Sphingomonas glacialis]